MRKSKKKKQKVEKNLRYTADKSTLRKIKAIIKLALE